MVEERHISTPETCPIQDTIEETHNTYNTNMVNCLKNFCEDSSLMIATHNDYSVQLGIDTINELQFTKKMKKQTVFAQLFGLGDHLSASVLNEGMAIQKYVPFGESDIMLPYLIRRAQESKQMLSAVYLQVELVKHELSVRMGGK